MLTERIIRFVGSSENQLVYANIEILLFIKSNLAKDESITINLQS